MKKEIVYNIVRRVEYFNILNKETGLYELKEKEYFVIFRKGTIFGFSHDVGDELLYSGGTFTSLNKFDSREQAKSYIPGFHKEKYGESRKFTIIEK